MKKILATTITTAIILLTILTTINIDANAQTTNPTALTITGLVNNQTNLTLAQLQALPKTTEYASIICVDAPQTILEEGNWTGVKLSVLLETAGIQHGAVKIAIVASDGFSSGLPVQTAMQNNIILAYEKDGQALSSLRLVVPGRWGYKWVNMVTKIEVTDNDYLGFWESKGYSDTAIVGQDPGGTGAKPPQSKPPVNTTSTSTPTPTLNPSATPTPPQTTPTSSQKTQPPSQNPTQNTSIPSEVIYAGIIGLIAALAIVALVVRKKFKR